MLQLPRSSAWVVWKWALAATLFFVTARGSAAEPVFRSIAPIEPWIQSRTSRKLTQHVQLSQSETANDDGELLTYDPPLYAAPAKDDEPDIDMPGPDMGDFPNSAFTLRKGRIQLEIAPASFGTSNAKVQAVYGTPFLFRYGITDDVEFRLTGNGFTALLGENDTTGFGVLIFDTKIHLWDAQMDRLIPAASFEASLQTEFGSPAFRAGTEPSLNINLDFPLTPRTNFETTLGYSGSVISTNAITGTAITLAGSSLPSELNEYFFSIQWALEQEVTDTFDVFIHGFCNIPLHVPGESTGVVIGAGFFQKVSTRVMLFGSANAGITSDQPPFLGQLGFAYAF